MIVVDTSAIIAIAFDDPPAEACIRELEQGGQLLMSAGTLTELLIVAGSRDARGIVDRMLERLGIEIVEVTAAFARRAADAYRRYGKGFHAAHLNFGDCFAYALARERQCPLLYVGNDFVLTDVESAI